MKEIILVNVGQAAMQIASPSWQLFCIEHSIQPDGLMSTPEDTNERMHHPDIFFRQTGSNKYVPRCINIDLQPNSIDEMRTGPHRQLFDPSTFVSGVENGESNNFAGGYYTHGQQLIEQCMNRIRKQADDCHLLQGFIITNSIVGGGAGLGSLLLETLATEYQNKTKLNFSIHPSQKRSSGSEGTDPYDAMLSLHYLLEHSDVSITLGNEALERICHNNLRIESPTSLNLSRLAAHAISSLTGSLRCGISVNCDLAELQANLVPFPRINSLISSYAPILPLHTLQNEVPSIFEMTSSLFQASNVFAQCNPEKGKYMACTMTYRGDVVPKDISCCIGHLKTRRNIQFVDWCPTGFKVAINRTPPISIPGGDMKKVSNEVFMASNSTAISQVFSRIGSEFDGLYTRKVNLQEYYQFDNARENLAAIEQDYAEILVDQEQTGEEG